MVSALNKKLLRDLIGMKGQVISIALIVCMGVAVLIGSLSTYDSLKSAQEHFYQHYHFADVFTGLKRAPESMRTQIAELDGISNINTRIVEEVNLDIPGMDEPASAVFVSVPISSANQINRLHIRAGRNLEPHHNDEMLIGEAFAKAHNLKPGDKLIAIVNGRRETFKIVGIAISPEYVYTMRPGSLMPDNKHYGVMWLNHDALASAFDMEGAFNNVVITLAPGFSEEAVIEHLDKLLGQYGGLGAHSRREQFSNQFVSNELDQLEFMATVIPAIFIGIAAFLLNLVTSRLIALQREHIAILKSLGYNNLTVGLYYLKLVAVIVIFGSVLGIALGAWMGSAMTGLYKNYFIFPEFSYHLSAWQPITGFFVSLLAASAGAIKTVRYVVKLPTSVAMRPPTPSSFHLSFLERHNLLRWFGAGTNMIIRNIARKPMHNFLAALGIALGMSIVIMGLFWSDAIEHIIYAQFMTAERGQITVVFTDPVKKTALFELEEQPGVLKVEGYRAAPIRLRAGHRSYLTSLLGYDQHSEQRLLLNKDLQTIEIPPDQLLLSKSLAQILQVKPGDSIKIEVLEGKRHQITTQLANVVDDFIGLAAYADYSTVNKLLEEHNMISMASVIYDENQEKILFKKLKEMPKVATVNLKKTLLETFEQTFAEHLLVFTGFLASFAIVIAVGIVYNSARIALSERSFELASLRVLGFTRNEVTKLLLGELSAQFLVGIPLGFIIGYFLAQLSVQMMPAEMIRIPLIIHLSTYAFAAFTIIVAGILSAMVVRKNINNLDLVEALKTLD